MLGFVVILALLSATVILCLRKWKLLGWYQVYRKTWMPEADCYLCISFWLSVVLTMFAEFTTDLPMIYLIAPFAACSLTAFMLTVLITPE